MAQEDYALIIGIQDYPGLDDPQNGQPSLAGPLNDARAFRDWVIAQDGGEVTNDNDHIKMILSPNGGLGNVNVFNASPKTQDVVNAVNELRTISLKNKADGKGLRIGRRLYIFMAGHGIAPSMILGEGNEMEAALLMANVEPGNLGSQFHIPGAHVAKWFWKNDCFDEVLLFMDCCRENELVPSINYFLPNSGGNTLNGKRCFLFGTKWSRTTREKVMGDENGNVRGVFTKTLLKGLSGDAAVTDPAVPGFVGNITAFSLQNYLKDNIKNYFTQIELDEMKRQLRSPEPDYNCFPDSEGKDILIKTVPLKRHPVQFHLPLGASGNLQIRFNDQETPDLPPVAVQNPPCVIPMNLPRGRYRTMVSINNNAQDRIVTVTGFGDPGQNGITHVHF